MIVQGRKKTGVPLAINGIFGNMGVACAALVTGLLIDTSGWRSAFVIPGVLSIILGGLYLAFERSARKLESVEWGTEDDDIETIAVSKSILVRVFSIIIFTSVIGSIIFQSTTFSLPKVFAERLPDLAGTATLVGWYTSLVFAIAAFAQLVVGYLVDNHSVRTVFAWVALLQSVLFAIMMPLTGLAALVTAIAFMFVVFGEIPINDVLVARMARSEWRSRAYSVMYLIYFLVSASALPLIAWVHGSWGFSVLFAILAVSAFFIFVAVLFLPKTSESEKPVSA